MSLSLLSLLRAMEGQWGHRTQHTPESGPARGSGVPTCWGAGLAVSTPRASVLGRSSPLLGISSKAPSVHGGADKRGQEP